jgi:hypothetical protein
MDTGHERIEGLKTLPVTMRRMKRLASRLCGFLLLCGVCFLPLTVVEAQPKYRLVPGWGAMPEGASWGQVPGMAHDAKGDLRFTALNRPSSRSMRLARFSSVGARRCSSGRTASASIGTASSG